MAFHLVSVARQQAWFVCEFIRIEGWFMRTHNGFLLDYSGPFFPASRSNQITYECFCLMGGIANNRLFKMERRNGRHVYFTYHNVSLL